MNEMGKCLFCFITFDWENILLLAFDIQTKIFRIITLLHCLHMATLCMIYLLLLLLLFIQPIQQ